MSTPSGEFRAKDDRLTVMCDDVCARFAVG